MGFYVDLVLILEEFLVVVVSKDWLPGIIGFMAGLGRF